MRAAALVAAALLAGCAAPAAQVRIAVTEPLEVVWGIPLFPQRPVMEAAARAGVYGEEYERCTNALIERTFAGAGYRVRASRLDPGARMPLLPDTRYVIQLTNEWVRGTAPPTALGTREILGHMRLMMRVELFEAASRRLLWKGTTWLETQAGMNAVPVRQLLRDLGDAGALDIASDTALPDAIRACPENS